MYIVCVKSSDKLLNYLKFRQTLIEVNIETLKTHEFHPWCNLVALSCDQQEDGSHVHDQH